LSAAAGYAQSASGATQSRLDPGNVGTEPPVMDNQIFWHVLFNQLEDRTNGPDNELRWDGQAWIGTDFNKLWFKSEGFFNKHGPNGHGKLEDGIHEILYDRPIPFLRYFDWQAGFRYDGDSSPPRYWGALGIEGLAPEFFDVEATLYLRDEGYFAARVGASYDIFLTNRLIAQPEIEMNFYTKDDVDRAVGRGLSELDTGLRVRYEISPQIRPIYRIRVHATVWGDGRSRAQRGRYRVRSAPRVRNPDVVLGAGLTDRAPSNSRNRRSDRALRTHTFDDRSRSAALELERRGQAKRS
jgi:copper resistance protein B